jgi:hypothetical protein
VQATGSAESDLPFNHISNQNIQPQALTLLAPLNGRTVMRITFIDQTFYPDVVSSEQHLKDLAVRLAECGHEVTVVAQPSGV